MLVEVDNFKGNNILFVAGGIGLVPLRSLILEVLNKRSEYKKVFILYGCKTPKDFLFKDEIGGGENREDVSLFTTVELGDETWAGTVGARSNACW